MFLIIPWRDEGLDPFPQPIGQSSTRANPIHNIRRELFIIVSVSMRCGARERFGTVVEFVRSDVFYSVDGSASESLA